MNTRYVGWPEGKKKTYLYSGKDRSSKKFRQVLWGDFLKIEDDDGTWLTIEWAPRDPARRKTVFIPKEDTVETRPLEIIFLDVGQGDGAILITPESGDDEKIVIIDAGESDNMARFLSGRFKAYRGFSFHAAILTHPDKDHYFGFKEIFSNPRIGFEIVYQNGLIERAISGTFEKLGKTEIDPTDDTVFFTELATARADFEKHFLNNPAVEDFDFPQVMKAALDNPRIGDFGMLSTAHGTIENGRSYFPGMAPTDQLGYTVEILGPVVEPDEADVPRLRRINSYGETKNGHSVLLRLSFGHFSVLFGGDLNEPAEKFLLRHYSGLKRIPESGTAAYRNMIAAVATRFRSDVMKSCHHGSEKVTDAFLEVVNPAAFVISSGDQEGHIHPRPDLLGRLGKFGRGGAPVILSTELQRSTREKEDAKIRKQIDDNVDRLARSPSPALAEKIKQQVSELAKTNVEVYGAIYLKTDGRRLMTAFRIETKSQTKKWFYYGYTILPNGELARIS
jgi:beta-lactamase superfamily II metal-dependent hydrolase